MRSLPTQNGGPTRKRTVGTTVCSRYFFRKSGEPSRTRTCDPLVKSQLLYQLSYRPTLKRSDSLRFQVSSFKFALRRAVARLDVVHVIRRLHIDQRRNALRES